MSDFRLIRAPGKGAKQWAWAGSGYYGVLEHLVYSHIKGEPVDTYKAMRTICLRRAEAKEVNESNLWLEEQVSFSPLA